MDSDTKMELALAEFLESVKPVKLCYLRITAEKYYWHWVFWSQEKDDTLVRTGIVDHHFPNSERIKHALLSNRRFCLLSGTLVQFWTPKRREGGRCFLSTCDQPFLLGDLCKGLFSYRKQSMNKDIYISEEEEEFEEQLGPVGRAFCNRQPESTPQVCHYTLQEYPLRDQAKLSGTKYMSTFPVFEIHNHNCVGVLEVCSELVCLKRIHYIFEQGLKIVGLTLNHTYSEPDAENQQDSWEEIKGLLKVVARAYPLALALALVPIRRSRHFNDDYYSDSSELGFLKLAFYETTSKKESYSNFTDAHEASYLKIGQGVSGKSFASRNSYFCKNICDFNITEYPLVHYAHEAGLTLSFAICLQAEANQYDEYDDDDDGDYMVLEFFLLPGDYSDEHIRSLLGSLIASIKQHLQGFKIISEDVILDTEDSVFQAINALDSTSLSISSELQQMHTMLEDDYFSERYSLSEFFEYMKTATLACLPNDEEEEQNWVFWKNDESSQDLQSTEGLISHCPISERIKCTLHQLLNEYPCFELIQFWVPKRIGERYFLTTSGQPFSVAHFEKPICSYIKQCMDRDIIIPEEGEENKEQLGPIGRAFYYQQPEGSPDVQYYSLQEFPQRDFARLCGISQFTALPVFDIHGKSCVGILEAACYIHDDSVKVLAEKLWNVGLTLNQQLFEPGRYAISRVTTLEVLKRKKDSWKEIKELFEMVEQTYPLAMALAFIPSISSSDPSCLSVMKLAFYLCNKERLEGEEHYVASFIEANEFLYLEKGKGVAGKALTLGKPCFCRNICNLSITEYPFAHYARKDGLTLSLAICLQDTQSKDDQLVLEFFMLPGNDTSEHARSLLEALLAKAQQNLQSYEILSRDVRATEVISEITNSVHNYKRACREYGIIKWPFLKKNKISGSVFEKNNTFTTPQSLVPTTPTVDAGIVAVEASYEEHPIIKFDLSFTSTYAQLEEEVGKRLSREVGSFKIFYREEDNDSIAITCDTDLQYCMKTVTSSDRTSTIRMTVLLNSY